MRTRIWNNMANTKFKVFYLSQCSRWADIAGRAYSLFLSIASASCVAAWALWQELPWLWAAFVAIAQILHLAKPYLHFMKSEKDFLEMSFEFNYLYLEYERLWVAYEDGRLDDARAENTFYELREKETDIEKVHKQVRCPRLKCFIVKAQQETEQALAINFAS